MACRRDGKELAVIPTLILVGAVFGALVAGHTPGLGRGLAGAARRHRRDEPRPGLAGVAGLAVLNAGAGVLLYQGIRRASRKLRQPVTARRST
jgi:hypothetical protein